MFGDTPLRHFSIGSCNRRSSLQCLNLRLLVDAKHQSFARRLEVKPHDIADFFDEVRVIRELEMFDTLGLQSMLVQNPVNARRAHPKSGRQRSTCPMRSMLRFLMPDRRDNILDLRRADRCRATRPRSVLKNPESAFRKSRAQRSYSNSRPAVTTRDLGIRNAFCGINQNASALSNPLRSRCSPNHRLQFSTMLG